MAFAADLPHFQPSRRKARHLAQGLLLSGREETQGLDVKPGIVHATRIRDLRRSGACTSRDCHMRLGQAPPEGGIAMLAPLCKSL
jgi:hypothetical protein